MLIRPLQESSSLSMALRYSYPPSSLISDLLPFARSCFPFRHTSLVASQPSSSVSGQSAHQRAVHRLLCPCFSHRFHRSLHSIYPWRKLCRRHYCCHRSVSHCCRHYRMGWRKRRWGCKKRNCVSNGHRYRTSRRVGSVDSHRVSTALKKTVSEFALHSFIMTRRATIMAMAR